jgi:ABC-type nitrate/sulfonate/bicarbonate transport system ATPase subunit
MDGARCTIRLPANSLRRLNRKVTTTGHISIRDVSKIYDPEGAHVLAVERCSLDIEPSEFCVVVGPSGCGKTTLLNAIAGFHGITDGEIVMDGELLCSASRTTEPSAERMVVFQNGALFPWYTVMQNITYGPVVQGRMSAKEARGNALSVLGELGLTGIQDQYPNEISSGMRRRVEIARALINDPKVLLLDEPFRALDALTKSVAQEFLLQALDRANKTVFFITHDLEEALFLGRKVVIMTTRPGKVKKIITVDFPKPRTFRVRSSQRYLELKTEVFEAVHEEALKAFKAGERELA